MLGSDPRIAIPNLGGDYGFVGAEPLRPTGTGRARGVELFAQRKLLGSTYLLGRLDVRLLDVDPVDTARLALATGLTAYDAACLGLARALGAELVTLDAALARAAGRR